MSSDVIETEGYRFWNFKGGDNLVTFNVIPLFGRDLNKKELDKLEAMLDDLGKWENLVKSGQTLLSELKMVTLQPADAVNYEKPYGPDQYETAINQVDNKTLEVSIRLVNDESCIREERKMELLSVKEIWDQISNLSKWRCMHKAIEDLHIKEVL
ncbi:MAG TPA: hypothetical protein VK536_05330 [Candidatus Limnocylindrales bacterium]|nr:hypothetical protein [Candidatus Limnocylindrales bacterium]